MKKDYENVIYGKSLQEIRKRNNLTQEQAGLLTGLEAKYISQIECGITKGTIGTMLKFCEAYNVTPNDVLYKFLKTTKARREINIFTNNLSKLSKRDKEIVFSLIDLLLKN